MGQHLFYQVRLILVVVFLSLTVLKLDSHAGKFDPGKAGFRIKFKNEISTYRILAIFVLPQEQLHLQALNSKDQAAFKLKATQGNIITEKPDQWLWQAPAKPGLYPITILHSSGQDSMRLNIFVMVPFDSVEKGRLKGCYIGDYPEIPESYSEKYKTPSGFIELTEQNQDVWIAPHFQLKQFICKQSGGFPKYTVLEERLLLKLELILETINARGIYCKTLTIMSGYRTPFYNKEIGNVKFSRHIFGAAADFYIDESPQDGEMDDVNGDGKIDIRDAQILSDHIESLSEELFYEPFQGGLAVYKQTASHGPFVHVDVRGYKVGW